MYCASTAGLDLRFDEAMDVIGIRFHPRGLSRFSDLAMSRMPDREVPVDEAPWKSR